MSLLQRAADAIGWTGTVIPDMRLFDPRAVALVADIDSQRLARRQATDPAPTFDYDTLAMWEWPEGADVYPPSPVRLAGVIVPPGRATMGRLRLAASWRGFGSAALLLDGPIADDDLLLEADYAGVWVVARTTGGGVRVVQPGANGRAEKARRTVTDRWVEEQLYERLLAMSAVS